MTNLNAGYVNNINAVTVRANGNKSHVYTDRAIDFDGDGVKEKASLVITPTGNGSVITEVSTVPSGAPRTIIHEHTEPDGGVTIRSHGQYSEGL